MLKCVLVFLWLSNVKGTNILGFFPFPSYSHQVVYQPIWRELSLRGHKVTVVTPNPLNDSSLVNLTEIDVGYTYEILKSIRLDQLMSKDVNKFQLVPNIYYLMDIILKQELDNPSFQKILNDENQEFNLILYENFHPVICGLAAKYKAPIIGVSSLGSTIIGHDTVGNPTHPVLNPDMMLNFHDNSLGIWQKIQSVMHNAWYRFYYNFVFIPRADKMAREYFGNDIPYLGDLDRNISMLFLNVNPLLYSVRPNVPAVVELGQMHLKPVKPLPSDLQQILDKAREGVIYFSLGTNVKSVNIPEKLRINIIGALSELPYKVLWKWESDHLPERPHNVITRKWIPQQDVLAHPNVKAFVTQGGLQSTEEAISRGVPLIGMPFLGDQPMNVQKLVELGVAVGVDPATVSKEQLKSAIIEVAENKKYRNKIKEMRDLLLDQPMTGLEKAVWWSEYVIRHKGARHLRSPALDMPWYYYYMLDVMTVCILLPLTVVYLTLKLMTSNIKTNRNKRKIKST